jgi:hypothetical protein
MPGFKFNIVPDSKHTKVMGNSSSSPNGDHIVDTSGDETKEWNVILLGDSTIDNKGYCGREGTSVTEHFESKVGKVTLRAQDGALISAIERQLNAGVPAEATHLVVSVGGNNLLSNLEVMRKPCASVTEAMLMCAEISKEFEAEYEKMLNLVLEEKKPIMLCAVYRPNFERTGFQVNQEAVDIAQRIFHDVIFKMARKYRLPVVDLRSVVGEAEDYANPIELDTPGGLKLTNAIIAAIKEHQKLNKAVSVVYPQS